MHVQEKWAWYVLAVTAGTFVLHCVIVAAYGIHQWTFAVYGLLGLLGLVPLIGRRGRKSGAVVFDERDHEIARRAYQISFGSFWLLLVFGLFAPALVLGFGETTTKVPLTSLAWILFPAFGFVMLVRHATILILYRRS